MRKWYEFRAQPMAQGANAEIYIYDSIGNDPFFGGVGAKQFIEELKGFEDLDVDVFINSPGGQVFEGVAIYNALARHKPNVNVHIEGMALSVASLIAMSGDTVTMAENGLMMIHDPWVGVSGNASELRKEADTLDKVKEGMLSSYQQKAKVERSELSAMMSEETWLAADEAKTLGFVDSVAAPVEMNASFDLSKYNYRHTPNVSAIHRAKVLIAEIESS